MYKKDERSVEKKGDVSVRRDSGQMNFGMVVLVLGILIMLAVLAIKFTSTGDTSEFLGITNPKGVYGEYFMSGIVVGLVVLIIGAVLSRKKEEPLFEEEEEEEFLDLEEEEEGICPTCGAIIAVSCTECPECGEELEPPEEEPGEEIECPICGATVSADATECPECGEPISEEAEETDEDDLFADLDEL